MHTSATQSWPFYPVSSPSLWPIPSATCKSLTGISEVQVCAPSSAPFDSAILTFIAMCVLLVTSWSENYGDANAPISQSFVSAWKSIKSGEPCEKSPLVEPLGVFQIERSFSWASSKLCSKHRCTSSSWSGHRPWRKQWICPRSTKQIVKTLPFLTVKNARARSIRKAADCWSPGYVFASYMVAMMMGSNSFKVFCNYTSPESFMRWRASSCAIDLCRRSLGSLSLLRRPVWVSPCWCHKWEKVDSFSFDNRLF